MKKDLFSKKEQLLKSLELYKLANFLIDSKLIRKDLYWSSLFRRHTTQLLIKHFGPTYGGHLINKPTGNLGFGLIHYSLINILKPKRILCLGSQRGFIPAICALACKDNQYGQVDFVDAGKDVNDKNSWGGIGFWKQTDPQKHFSILNLNPYISTYIITSQQFAKKHQRKYQYIYIDADHSYPGVKADFKLFWPRLIKNGLISFHDINATGKRQGIEFGVKKFWQELKIDNKISFCFKNDSLGIIQK